MCMGNCECKGVSVCEYMWFLTCHRQSPVSEDWTCLPSKARERVIGTLWTDGGHIGRAMVYHSFCGKYRRFDLK
jgi:hypothetical protein